MWSFVGNKENKHWIWLAMDVVTRQIIAFHVGGRGQEDAEKLWQPIPAVYREEAHFFTEVFEDYEGIEVSAGDVGPYHTEPNGQKAPCGVEPFVSGHELSLLLEIGPCLPGGLGEQEGELPLTRD